METKINKETVKSNGKIFELTEGGAVLVESSTSAEIVTNGFDTEILGAVGKAKIAKVTAGANKSNTEVFSVETNKIVFNNVTASEVYGGAFAMNYTTKSNGKVVAKVSKVGLKPVASVGTVDLVFTGGKVTSIYGGGAGYGSYVGQVNISLVQNFTVSAIYGAGKDGARVGNVNISIGRDNTFLEGSKISKIYAAGKNSIVEGDAKITFNSGSSTVKFTGLVSGSGTNKNSYVLGTSTLAFDGYEGDFKGTIKNFDKVQLIGGAQVSLKKAQDKTMKAADYEFVITDESLGNSSAMLTWDKKFSAGDIIVTIDMAEELAKVDNTITLIASSKFTKADSFNIDNIRVQNADGEVISNLYYDLDYTYGKKGGSITITYTDSIDLGDYDKALVLNDADDYINIKTNSLVSSSINMKGGDNKLVVQSNAQLTGEVIFEDGSNNTVIVNGIVSGAFDSQAGSNNLIKLNSGKVGYYYDYDDGKQVFVAAAIDLGDGNDILEISGNSDFDGINFGNGQDVLVMNNDLPRNAIATWGMDGNDAVVINYNGDLRDDLGLQGTGNVLVVGNGRTVQVSDSLFLGGSDSIISGVYLNDNAMLQTNTMRVIQNYVGDIANSGDITILVADSAAPEHIAPYYSASGNGVKGVFVGSQNDQVRFGAFGKSGVAGGAQLTLADYGTISVAADTIAQIGRLTDANFNEVTAFGYFNAGNAVVNEDAALVVANDDFVFAGNVTKDVDYTDAAYLGAKNIYFVRNIDAAVSVADQVVWNAENSLKNITFNGNSMIGFYDKVASINWNDVNYDSENATVGIAARNNSYVTINRGDVWGWKEIASIVKNSELSDSVLSIKGIAHIGDWNGNFNFATDTGKGETVLIVKNESVIDGSLNVSGATRALIGDGVVIEDAVRGGADNDEAVIGKAEIYGGIAMGDGDDTLVLAGTVLHDDINQDVTIAMGAGNDQVVLSGAVVEGVINMDAGVDTVKVAGAIEAVEAEGASQINFVPASSKLNVVKGADVTLEIANGGVLESLIPEGSIELGGTVANEDAGKAALVIGDGITLGVDVNMFGAQNTLKTGLQVTHDYTDIDIEESFESAQNVEGFNSTVASVVTMNSTNNTADLGVGLTAEGWYANSDSQAADDPNYHKEAILNVTSDVNVKVDSTLKMGEANADRFVSDVEGTANTVNTFNAGLDLLAKNEGVLNVDADINIQAVGVDMVGQTNTVSMVIDVEACQQSVLNMNGKANLTMGDLDMLALKVDQDDVASNTAIFGLDTFEAYQKAPVYGNGDFDDADGVLNATKDQFTVTVGNITMLGVGDTAVAGKEANTYDTVNNLTLLDRSVVNGTITMGEYYRDAWTKTNNLAVQAGAVVAGAVAMTASTNNVAIAGSAGVAFQLNGLKNNFAVASTGVVGSITSDNINDIDQFAAEDYLNGAYRTGDDYADLTVTVTGGKVAGDIKAFGSKTQGNVTGRNYVELQDAAEVTGVIDLITNDQNSVVVEGSVAKDINLTATEIIAGAEGKNIVEVYGDALAGNITMSLGTAAGADPVSNEAFIGFDLINGDPQANGAAVVNDIMQTAGGKGFNGVYAFDALIGNITQATQDINGYNDVMAMGEVLTGDIDQTGAANRVYGAVDTVNNIGNITQTGSINWVEYVNSGLAGNGNGFSYVAGEYDEIECKYSYGVAETVKTATCESSVGNITQTGDDNTIILENVNYGDINVIGTNSAATKIAISTSRIDILAVDEELLPELDYHEVIGGVVPTKVVDSQYAVTSVGNITLEGDGAYNYVEISGWTGNITSLDAGWDVIAIDGLNNGYKVGNINVGKWDLAWAKGNAIDENSADEIWISSTDDYSSVGTISNSTDVKNFADLGALDLNADCSVVLGDVSFNDIHVSGMIKAEGDLVVNGLAGTDANLSADAWNKEDNTAVDLGAFEWIYGVSTDTVGHNHLIGTDMTLTLGGNLEFNLEDLDKEIVINVFKQDEKGVWSSSSEEIKLTWNEDANAWQSEVESFACGHEQWFEMTASDKEVKIGLVVA